MLENMSLIITGKFNRWDFLSNAKFPANSVINGIDEPREFVNRIDDVTYAYYTCNGDNHYAVIFDPRELNEGLAISVNVGKRKFCEGNDIKGLLDSLRKEIETKYNDINYSEFKNEDFIRLAEDLYNRYIQGYCENKLIADSLHIDTVGEKKGIYKYDSIETLLKRLKYIEQEEYSNYRFICFRDAKDTPLNASGYNEYIDTPIRKTYQIDEISGNIKDKSDIYQKYEVQGDKYIYREGDSIDIRLYNDDNSYLQYAFKILIEELNQEGETINLKNKVQNYIKNHNIFLKRKLKVSVNCSPEVSKYKIPKLEELLPLTGEYEINNDEIILNNGKVDTLKFNSEEYVIFRGDKENTSNNIKLNDSDFKNGLSITVKLKEQDVPFYLNGEENVSCVKINSALYNYWKIQYEKGKELKLEYKKRSLKKYLLYAVICYLLLALGSLNGKPLFPFGLFKSSESKVVNNYSSQPASNYYAPVNSNSSNNYTSGINNLAKSDSKEDNDDDNSFEPNSEYPVIDEKDLKESSYGN